MVTTELCYIKWRKEESHTYIEWHWGLSKPFFWKALNPLDVYQFKKCLYLVCLQKEMKSVSIMQLPENADYWTSISDNPDNHYNWATSMYSDTANYSNAEKYST